MLQTVYRARMTATDEQRALTASIGEFTLDLLGREKISGLRVTFDPRERSAFMTIVLRDDSDESQRRVIGELFEVERVFAEDAVLTYVFVDHIEKDPAEASSELEFSYA